MPKRKGGRKKRGGSKSSPLLQMLETYIIQKISVQTKV